MQKLSILLFSAVLLFSGCKTKQSKIVSNPTDKIPVIFDTDCNNELDDQHALAYLIFNDSVFDLKGVTVNATWNGGDITQHYAEAKRVMELCGVYDSIPLKSGANSSFPEILPTLDSAHFDGEEAVNFMIQQAAPYDSAERLIILAVGKLTNVALAVKKDPEFVNKVRLVWLGSNYPAPGEYNQDNDTASMNYLLNTNIPFDLVTVRYNDTTGTTMVRVTPDVIMKEMPGKGPHVTSPVTGRHGGEFNCFGDYSANLFEHAELHGDPPARSLFDMAAVAIVKNPDWASFKEIPAPILINNQWQERPDNQRKITVVENFHRKAILEDFFNSFKN